MPRSRDLPKFGFHTTSEEVMSALGAYARDRTFIITGTTPGTLGAETVLALARSNPAPAHLILLSRSKERTAPLLADVAAAAPNLRVSFIPCDMGEPDSVRAAAKAILEDATIPTVDVLINNAGTIMKKHSLNSMGVEMQLAVNHCGPFLLSNLLLPKIVAAGPGCRIVNLSSMCHQISPFRFHDAHFLQTNGADYDCWTSYGSSKTAGILTTVEFARRVAPLGVGVFAVHPGVIKTNLRQNGVTGHDFAWLRSVTMRNTGIDTFSDPYSWEFKTLSQGAATTLVAALDPRLKGASGHYLEDCNIGNPRQYATDKASARALWNMTEAWVGQRFNAGSDVPVAGEEEQSRVADGAEVVRARL